MTDANWYITSMTTSTIGACVLLSTYKTEHSSVNVDEAEELLNLIMQNRISIQKIDFDSISEQAKEYLIIESQMVNSIGEYLQLPNGCIDAMEKLRTWKT
ncbi:hypothetical protein LA020_002891 [Vibrio alginolyticus]|nr:hypothetical protein [Vibrio alginolyticus]